jgi:hypothetical protein
MAAQIGHTDSLRVLVHAKADIDKATTDDGSTPAFAAAQNGHTDSLRVLVHAKADIDKARTDDGTTPAFVAAQNGHTGSLQVLVCTKADIDKARTDDGTAPAFVVGIASAGGGPSVCENRRICRPSRRTRTSARHRRCPAGAARCGARNVHVAVARALFGTGAADVHDQGRGELFRVSRFH